MPTDKKITIVFLDADTIGQIEDISTISSQGNYIAYPYTSPGQVVERLSGAQVAITNKVKIGAEAIKQLPDLELICVAATGVNNIDMEAAKSHNVAVKNVAAYSTASVAQLTLTSLFTLSMDLIHLNQSVYDGTYTQASSFSYWRQSFRELTNAKFGIIGMGAIGQSVAELVTAYGADVVYYSTSGKNQQQKYPSVSLDVLLETCDVISIHAPLNAATDNLITYEELSKMKRTAYLLNMGRGGIVNESDLAKAIDESLIAGAAVDVFSQEPIAVNHPYLSVQHKHRLLLTPHIGWASVEARNKLVEGIANNIQAWKAIV